MTVVDAHTHAFAPEQLATRSAICARDPAFAEIYGDPKAALATPAHLLTVMAAEDVDRAVVVGFAFAHADDLALQNAALCAAAEENAGRLLPLVSVNPQLPEWKETAVALLERGARGFGELRPHNQGWDPLGPHGHALCDVAEAHGAILLWHVSEPLGHAYPGKAGGIEPIELYALAASHPRVPMIAAHMGGGLAIHLQMPEIRAALPGLYFDTAAFSLLYDDSSVARLVGLAGVGRVLFGSDYPLLSPRRQVQRIRALLGDEVAQAVCGDNAVTLFSDADDR
ncbi:MAG: amidohydrolase family protein [Dehalococcoidia bacterium]|nr:amidohydrolase family protein [Dehalococcoidia bacterium]